jgi:penicillin-binding protein 1A
MGAVVLFFLFASWGLLGDAFIWRFGKQTQIATEVISADGVVIGKYFQKKQISLKYSDLPKTCKHW